jgi:protein-S-isoprenylcysteine O-methyltransferase Ste14
MLQCDDRNRCRRLSLLGKHDAGDKDRGHRKRDQHRAKRDKTIHTVSPTLMAARCAPQIFKLNVVDFPGLQFQSKADIAPFVPCVSAALGCHRPSGRAIFAFGVEPDMRPNLSPGPVGASMLVWHCKQKLPILPCEFQHWFPGAFAALPRQQVGLQVIWTAGLPSTRNLFRSRGRDRSTTQIVNRHSIRYVANCQTDTGWEFHAMNSSRSRFAAVLKIPPPLLFVGAFAAGMGFNRVLPFSFPGGAVPVRAGVAFLFAGIALALSLVLTFLLRRTTLNPFADPSAFFTTGAYRFSRNPMYLALIITYIGGSLALDTPWPLLILPLPVLILSLFVIPCEEANMTAAFGESYKAYCARVRRWL